MLSDLRYAIRQLTKSPGFAAAAILTLGLGLGANATLFNLVNSVLFRSRGFHDPAALVSIYTQSKDWGHSVSSYPDYVDLRDQSRTLSGVTMYRLGALGLQAGDRTRSLWSETVTGNYFDVLGVAPQFGRGFEPRQDDVPGAPLSVVISDQFWQREFHRDRGVLGRSLRLNGQPFTVVGVAPRSFAGMVPGLVPSVWITYAALPRIYPGNEVMTNRGNHGAFIVARRNPGASLQAIGTELAVVGHDLAARYPTSNAGLSFVALPTSSVTFVPEVDGTVSVVAVVLMVIPALVLLIACANLATLLLARATGRRQELTVRLALGASRWRVARQLLTESVVLGLLGGGVGLLLSSWLTGLLASFQPPLPIPVSLDLAIDTKVVAFTLGLSVLAGVVFGLAPALGVRRLGLATELREGAAGSRRTSRLRAGLLVGQLAVSVLLLVGAALLLRSVGSAGRIDLGFAPAGVVTTQFDFSYVGFDVAKATGFMTDLAGRVEATPGVKSVSWGTRLPLNLNVSTNKFYTESTDRSPSDQLPEIQVTAVGPRYFTTIGAHLVAGREFTNDDRVGRPGVTIVNESAAKLLWPGQPPLGKRLANQGQSGPGRWREVIGVVRDLKVMTVGERPTPQVFGPVYDAFDSYVTMVTRTTIPPDQVARSIRNLVAAVDPSVTIINAGTLNEVVDAALFPMRFAAGLLLVLGLLGLLIASIGLYGVISHGVVQRSRELGIRMALGADGSQVIRMVAREGMVVVGVGLLIGLGAAALTTRALATFLYGVAPLDPVAFIAGPAVLWVVGFVACILPARRAARVDPIVSIRSN